MVIVIGSGFGNPNSNLNKAVCILHSAHIQGYEHYVKCTQPCSGLNSSIVPPAMSKIVEQRGLLNLWMKTG